MQTKTGMFLMAATVIAGAVSWLLRRRYSSKTEEEDEECVLQDREGNTYFMSEIKKIDLSKIKEKCHAVDRELDDDFKKLPFLQKQRIIGNAQMEEVFYSVGPFLHKYGGLPAVHKALEDYGDVVERTKWYAPLIKSDRNFYL